MTDESDTSGSSAGGDGAALPRDVQEHLGRQLRATLRAEEARPAFLGDTTLPPQFERHIRRLEIQERGVQRGYEAVRDALADPLPDATPPGLPDDRPV